MSKGKLYIFKNCSGKTEQVVVDGVQLYVEPGQDIEILGIEVSFVDRVGETVQLVPKYYYYLGQNGYIVNPVFDPLKYIEYGMMIVVPFVGFAILLKVLRLLDMRKDRHV